MNTQIFDIPEVPKSILEIVETPIEALSRRVKETLYSLIGIEQEIGENYEDIKGNLVKIMTSLGTNQSMSLKVQNIISGALEVIEEDIFTEENKLSREKKLCELRLREKLPRLRVEAIALIEFIKTPQSMEELSIKGKLLKIQKALSSDGAFDVEIVSQIEEELSIIRKKLEEKINTQKLFELYEIFEYLKQQEIDGVKGCYAFESGLPGPIIGMSICTHGNEPAGLAVFKYFLESGFIPESGKVIFTCNNLQATEEYFHAETEDDKKRARFSKGGVNMNRISEQDLREEKDIYEIKRSIELQKVQVTFTSALDIHSTLNPSTPMIISVNKDMPSIYLDGMRVKTVIENILDVQSGIPIAKLYGEKGANIPVLGIECGQHENGESFQTALECAQKFIENSLRASKNQEETHISIDYQKYRVTSSVKFAKCFSVARDFHEFEVVKKGTILGISTTGKTLSAQEDCIILFGKSKGYVPESETEEVFFCMQLA